MPKNPIKKPIKRRSPSPPPSLEELMASHLSQAMDQMLQAVMERFLPQPGQIPGASRSSRSRSSAQQSERPGQPGPTSPTSPTSPTLYDLLQVSPEASPEVITAAWRSLSKRHHPDKGGSEEIIKQLNAAHDILSDPQKRRHYDQSIYL